MKKVFQTRFGDEGNCYSACIASLMDKDSAEDVIQIVKYYDNDRWVGIFLRWLACKGWIAYPINSHNVAKKDEFYIVIGKSPRHPTDTHVCIYQNGKLFHDPHPDNTGILTEDYFEIIEKL